MISLSAKCFCPQLINNSLFATIIPYSFVGIMVQIIDTFQSLGYNWTSDPLCPCGLNDETIQHVLLDCAQYIEARDSMVTSIEKGYIVTTFTHSILYRFLM